MMIYSKAADSQAQKSIVQQVEHAQTSKKTYSIYRLNVSLIKLMRKAHINRPKIVNKNNRVTTIVREF